MERLPESSSEARYERQAEVERMMVVNTPTAVICRELSERYGVTSSQIRSDVKASEARMKRRLSIDVEQRRNKDIARMEFVVTEAMKDKRWSEAVAAQKLLSQLQDTIPDKKANHGESMANLAASAMELLKNEKGSAEAAVVAVDNHGRQYRAGARRTISDPPVRTVDVAVEQPVPPTPAPKSLGKRQI